MDKPMLAGYIGTMITLSMILKKNRSKYTKQSEWVIPNHNYSWIPVNINSDWGLIKWNKLACVARVSTRVHWESWNEGKKTEERERGRGRGRGRGEKETLACKATILQSFWLVRCWWWQIKNALEWYLFESCLCQGLSDLSPFKV